MTGKSREIIKITDGMYKVQSGGKSFLYVPESKLPVIHAEPKGIRAIVESEGYDFNKVRLEFGSDGSSEANTLLGKAWKKGWRPGD
jgi:hypothetical protein